MRRNIYERKRIEQLNAVQFHNESSSIQESTRTNPNQPPATPVCTWKKWFTTSGVTNISLSRKYLSITTSLFPAVFDNDSNSDVFEEPSAKVVLFFYSPRVFD